MKRLLCFAAALLSLLPTISACAIRREPQFNGVRLIAIDAAQVGVAECDYYLVAEPSASTRISVVSGLKFAGSLQELYGGDGYPQAVVVAKNELLGYSVCREFFGAVERNASWLASAAAMPEKIVGAVDGHLSVGLAPTFSVKNLTTGVIKNCGIKATPSPLAKDKVISFIDELNMVVDTPFYAPDDDFFFDVATCGEDAYGGKIKVVAPDGAPALALASLLAGEDTVIGADVEYEIVNPTLIQAFVGGNSPKADICVLPINLAAKLLGTGGKYSLLGVATRGNLFLLSKSGEPIESDNVSELIGKRVGVVNLAQVPGLTFKIILRKYSISYVVE